MLNEWCETNRQKNYASKIKDLENTLQNCFEEKIKYEILIDELKNQNKKLLEENNNLKQELLYTNI